MVLIGDGTTKAVAVVDLRSSHRPVMVLGLGLLAVVAIDLAAMWWDPQLSAASWVLRAVPQTLGRMPMLLLALALVGSSGLISGSAPRVRVVAGAYFTVAILVLLLGLRYGFAAIEVWPTVRPEMVSAFKRSGLATAALGFVYFVTCATLGIMIWKRTRTTRSR